MLLHHGGRGSGSIRRPTTAGCTGHDADFLRPRFRSGAPPGPVATISFPSDSKDFFRLDRIRRTVVATPHGHRTTVPPSIRYWHGLCSIRAQRAGEVRPMSALRTSIPQAIGIPDRGERHRSAAAACARGIMPKSALMGHIEAGCVDAMRDRSGAMSVRSVAWRISRTWRGCQPTGRFSSPRRLGRSTASRTGSMSLRPMRRGR
ncbi:hypothetical protein DM40_4000 [Burkholderia cenocepacia]|nr:hypothetical protein DM40_4000 [Burkholderia cenocepacia]